MINSQLYDVHQIQELLNSLSISNHILKGTTNMVQMGEKATTIHVKKNQGFVLYTTRDDFSRVWTKEKIGGGETFQLYADTLDKDSAEKQMEYQASTNPDAVFCIEDGNHIYYDGPSYQPDLIYVYSNAALEAVIKVIKSELLQSNAFWPSHDEYPVDLTKEDWKRFIEEVEISHRGCMRVLKCYLDIGGVASHKTMAERYKGLPSVYSMSIYNTSRRALKFFGMKPYPDALFAITFLAKRSSGDDEGAYVYKMREELFDALKEIDLSDIRLDYKSGVNNMDTSQFSKNTILYGPPGTGKTYNTVKYAVAICEERPLSDYEDMDYSEILQRYDQLKADNRIAFTTFHQSYGYEEFIEGIKPIIEDENNEIGYKVEPGIFKRFCELASRPSEMKADPSSSIWFMNLDTDNGKRKEDCFQKDEVNAYLTEDDAWGRERFIDGMQIGDYVLSYAGSSLYIDAIGEIKSEALQEESGGENNWYRKVTWHRLESKTNVRAINGGKYLPTFSIAKMNHMKVSDMLKLISDGHGEGEKKPFVFIIDEINRGNISKIFGELITLIEVTKRAGADEAMETTLPYSGEYFSVPDNVYILGTMNTADRSIALMDTALRRRFNFVEMMPDANVIEGIMVSADGETLDVANMLRAINQRIEYLYDREHTIGHAFFTRLRGNNSMECLAGIFKNNVVPLLQEYFYEDYEKIQMVLGDNDKSSDTYKFILDTKVNENELFKKSPQLDLHEKTYKIQNEAFDNIRSYIEITESRRAEE